MWGLGVLIPLLSAGALQVSQEPGEAQVTVGGEVTLVCWVLVAEPGELLRLEWMKEVGHGVLCDTRLHPSKPTPLESCGPRLHLSWQPPRATLSLRQAQGDDTGRYVCRVTLEIPRYSMATGNGTLLSVSPGRGHQAGLVWGLAGALGGTGLLLGLALLCRWCWRRNTDTNIYLNVLHPPGRAPKKLLPPPQGDEDQNIQGGQQWARVPPLPPKPKWLQDPVHC